MFDQHFSPSNLHLDDTEFHPHLDETSPSQSLGQNVRQLLIGSDMIDVNLVFFDAETDVVKLDVDVLTSIMVNWVFAEGDRRFVVDEQLEFL